MMICVTDLVENIVGKGENAGCCFPHFQKASFPGSLKRVNQITVSDMIEMTEFSKWVENTVRKGEIACYMQNTCPADT